MNDALKATIPDAGDESQAKDRNRDAKRRRREEDDDIQAVMALPAGRRLMWRILEQTGLRKAAYSPESGWLYFAEGHRNLGLWLQTTLQEADITQFLAMHREALLKEAERGR